MRSHDRSIAGVILTGLIGLCASGCGVNIDKDVNRLFLQRLGATSFTVYPAVVRSDHIAYDAPAARCIGEFLAGEELGEALIVSEETPITGSWGMNQAKMLRESADDFSAHVAAHPIDTDYALFAEYLFVGQGVGIGIHCTILDAHADVAWARLWNSHDKRFVEEELQSPDDCTTWLVGALGRELASELQDE